MKVFTKIISFCFVFLFVCFVGCKSTKTNKEQTGEKKDKWVYTDTSFVDLPVVQISGNMGNISKTNKVPVLIKYTDANQEFVSEATIKWQGSTSLMYAKKNYSITFMDGRDKNNITMVEKWGA